MYNFTYSILKSIAISTPHYFEIISSIVIIVNDGSVNFKLQKNKGGSKV